jgi:hypothetical protein
MRTLPMRRRLAIIQGHPDPGGKRLSDTHSPTRTRKVPSRQDMR